MVAVLASGACPMVAPAQKWPQVFNLRCPPVALCSTRLGAAHAPSPDARGCHRGIRSLDAALASSSWLRSASNAGSRGTGSPSLSVVLHQEA